MPQNFVKQIIQYPTSEALCNNYLFLLIVYQIELSVNVGVSHPFSL